MPFLDSSHHLAKTWLSFVRTSFVREMEFRTNFWLGISREILWFFMFVLTIKIIFQNTDSLAGWNEPEVLIVLAFSRLIEGTMHILFIRNIGEIPFLIQNGMFDYILTKPIPAQWHAAFKRFMFYNFGTFCTGIALLTYALIQQPDILTLPSVALSAVLVAIGMTIFYSLLILVTTLGFFLERLDAIWAFFYLFSEPLTYPFDIFPSAPRIAMTYIIPLAFVVFVPAQALTGRLAWWQLPVAIGIAALFLLLANIAWRAGLRRYTSASS